MSSTNKKAECIRRVGNWSKIEAKHRFDKRTFNKSQTDNDIVIASPKLDTIFDKIKELDEKDMKADGHVYKHMIYSDVKTQGYGAKIIAAAFIARGYNPAYGRDLTISDKALTKHSYKSFAVLCSTPVYSKPITVKLKNSVLSTYNSRPENVYGKNIRFLILDQGYKEGIDVFDIKYIHLFEPAITPSDQKQAIGRGTRMCGQQGLVFNNEKGWPLYVFRYNSLLPNDPLYNNMPTIHDLYLQLSGYDVRSLNLANELERMCMLGAVDYDLTKNIHSFSISGKKSLFTLPKEVEKELMKEKKEKEKVIMYGREYSKGEPINCKDGCKGTIPVPTEIMMLAWIVYTEDTYPFLMIRPRSFLCKEIIENKKYCDTLNKAWKNLERFTIAHKQTIQNSLKSMIEMINTKERRIYKEHVESMLGFLSSDIQEGVGLEYIKEASIKIPEHIPPYVKLNFRQMRKHIMDEFSDYKWSGITLENKCATTAKGGANIVDFTPSQSFVKDYFQPSNPYKGMLLYMSVGTGKTCTAIATASNHFEKEGYTILWVTRHTLKSDIWKNMFQQVCNLVLQEKLKDGLVMPKTLPEQKRLLPSNWIEPISYKQFSNFLSGRNKQLEKAIAARNGKTDPLYKTLIIIDEAHKLYAADVIGAEKPDVEVLRNMIHNSYKKSGKNSARLLLMSATPYTSDPMDLVKLLNMLREEGEFLPESFDAFSNRYLDAGGRFTTEGSVRFIQEITGYISYLNRENDIRQFAYPILTDIKVPISKSQPTARIDNQIKFYENLIDDYKTNIEEEIPEDIKYEKMIYQEKKEECLDLETKKEQKECQDKATNEYKEQREHITKQIESIKEKSKTAKKELREAKKKREQMEKEDISQETILKRDCFKQKK
jgi:hypothetical protein